MNLINTDQKIFSHVIASRLRKGLENLIGEEQIACMKNCQIHQVINLTRLTCWRMETASSVFALYFSNFFDNCSLKYLYHLLQVLETPANIV